MCLPIVGALISGIGAALGAVAQAKSYEAQSKYEARQAILENEAGAAQATSVQRQVNKVLGQQRAGFAARGLAMDGSARDVYDESATEGALDVATIRWNTKLASENYMAKSNISKMNAGMAMAAAPFAFAAPVIGSLASLPKFAS